MIKKEPSLLDIRDYFYVAEDIHTSGQPTAEQIELLGCAKFEIVINLATAKSPDAIQNEKDLVMQNNMAYVHIPVDWNKPLRRDFEKFANFFEPYHNFKMLVHCVRNMRVSAFIFLNRVIMEGLNPQDCLTDLLTIWKPNEVWQMFINKMLFEYPNHTEKSAWQVDWETLRVFKKYFPSDE